MSLNLLTIGGSRDAHLTRGTEPGGLEQTHPPPPPDFWPSRDGWRVVIIYRRPSRPWPADCPLGRLGPQRPHRPHPPRADGLTALKSGVSARNAASIPGAAPVGETPTTRNPGFAHTRALRHGALSCLCVPHDGAADAGVPDATATTRCRSHEDDGTSINARVPLPDHRDHQQTPADGPVAYTTGPRQATQDPQAQAGHPALSVTRAPPAAGDRVPVLWHRAQPHRLRSRKARRSCLETHSAHRCSDGLRSCDCAHDIPKPTTARCGRVDSR